MKKEITRGELYDIFGACASTATAMVNNKQKGNGSFLNFLFNNRDRALPILKEFEKERPVANEKLHEFSKKEQEIMATLRKPVVAGEEAAPVDNSALDALRLEYKEEIENWDKSVAEFEKKLETKLTFDAVTLKEENLPSEIAADVMGVIYKLVIIK